MPHEGEGEEAALLGELVDVEYLGPLDPQESSHLQPIVARALGVNSIAILRIILRILPSLWTCLN